MTDDDELTAVGGMTARKTKVFGENLLQSHFVYYKSHIILPGLDLRPSLWGGVLGSLQRGSDKCVRTRAKESGQICIPQERIELGNLDRAQEVSSLM
jgi:hypothetical protein